MTAKTKFAASALLIIGAAGVPLIAGCGGSTATKTEDTSAIRYVPTELFGSWQLAGTSGGFSGGGLGLPVPDRSVVFEKNGAVKWREAGMTTQNRYHLEVYDINTDGPFVYVVENGKKGGLLVSQLDDTTLTLSEGTADGFNYHYNRIK